RFNFDWNSKTFLRWLVCWGNCTAINSAVVINNVAIAPNTKPKTNNFTIPIRVKPVALSTQPIPGPANTALTINIKLN
ncbi:hypothetical protein LOS08_22055, partial [Proteus mirabilis]|nr:hypothetical protein [Proteus mirabilis]